MEYGDLHESFQGFANKPFRSDFRIPKAQSYGQNHYQRAPPLFPPPPPPPMTFQSPMASLEDNYEDYQDVHPPRNFQPRNNNWGPPRGNRRPPAFRPSAPTFDDGGSQMDSGPFKRKAFNFLPSQDKDLPEELKKMFNALHCNLCDAKMNSPLCSRGHYQSKHHEKKVNQWLTEWSQRTGEPMPKRQKKEQSSLSVVSGEGPKGPNAFFCEHCQIPLTSALHANQHFTGKRHRMVVAGRVCPKGSGYYDRDGNWVKQNKPTDDSSGRFGIGTSFIQNNNGNRASTPEPDCTDDGRNFGETAPDFDIPIITSEKIKAMNKVKIPDTCDPNFLYCSICKISVTSQLNMTTHLIGAKHKKNAAKMGVSQLPTPALQPPPPPPTSLLQQKQYQPQSNSYQAQSRKKTETISDCYNEPSRRKDYSIYRTPSGQYYCQHCNITAPNEGQFAAHIGSKIHSRNIKIKK